MKFIRDHRFCWTILFPVLLAICLVAPCGWVEAAIQDEGIDRGLNDKTIDPPMSNEQLRSADKFWDETEDLIFIGDITAFGSYSDLDSDDEWGGSCYGLFAPGYKIGERMIFIAMYDGQYDRRMELYSDDYGYRSRTEFQRHAFTPMLRIDFGEDSRYSLTPSVFYTATWNKDGGQDDSWDNGLYNYRDEGVSLDFNMRRVFGNEGTFKLGIQWYGRRYPNFGDSLLRQFDGRGYEDEKDYHGLIVTAGYRWIVDSGFSWVIEYSLLNKRLDDKTVIQSNGELSSTKQRDYINELDCGVWYTFDDMAGGVELGLDFNIRMYDSNQNFLYFNGPGSWDVNQDYFDYRSYRIRPNTAYTFEQIPLTARLSYAYGKVDYTDRWARDSLGFYAAEDDQWDSTHQIVFGLQFDLSEKMNLLAHYEYLKGRSNDDYEVVYTSDYKLQNVLIGFKYSF